MKLKSIVTVVAIIDVVLGFLGAGLMLSAASKTQFRRDMSKDILRRLDDLENQIGNATGKGVIVTKVDETGISWGSAVAYIVIIAPQIYSSGLLAVVTSPEINCFQLTRIIPTWLLCKVWIFCHGVYLLVCHFVQTETTLGVAFADAILRVLFILLVLFFGYTEKQREEEIRRPETGEQESESNPSSVQIQRDNAAARAPILPMEDADV